MFRHAIDDPGAFGHIDEPIGTARPYDPPELPEAEDTIKTRNHVHSVFGKKVFFLNPPGVIGEVLNALMDAEFEVYMVRNHEKLAKYMARDPHCLVFVNIDEGDDENVWRSWIKGIRDNPALAEARFGVITMLDDDTKRRHYIMNLGVEAGFIVVKIGVAKTTDIVLKMLEANEARGRRKYVRAPCASDSTEFNCATEYGTLRGFIKDISSVGAALVFTKDTTPPAGTRLKNLQMNLRGVRVILNAVVIRTDTMSGVGVVAVTMFEPLSVNEDRRSKIRQFIRKTLQGTMDRTLELA